MKPTMNDLKQRSIEIILQNQSETGAYIASPNFPNYRYCWFRDGAFAAYAMNLVSQHESAARFHAWAANVINQRQLLIESTIRKARQGNPIGAGDVLNTRYRLDGKPAEEDWPNFQLDGLGTWLWALTEHKRLAGAELPEKWLRAARLVADYLLALWRLPCYDCWEEFPKKIHPYTLASIYAGLRSCAALFGAEYDDALKEIFDLITTKGVSAGHFAKFIGSKAVDASLIGLAVPYQIVQPNDPVMKATIAQIESDLRSGAGVRRYSTDTYYGGGDWILLTAWLGWYYAEIGDREKATEALKWVEAQAGPDGSLPEQVKSNQTDDGYYRSWKERWGAIADPLLWSHANYIIVSNALANGH
jgi:GH15 family glucan-1,4-alpha-glucosidase